MTLTAEQQATYFAKLRAQYRALTAEQKNLITEEVFVARAYANDPDDTSSTREAAGLEFTHAAPSEPARTTLNPMEGIFGSRVVSPTVDSFVQPPTSQPFAVPQQSFTGSQPFAVQLQPATVSALDAYFAGKPYNYDALLTEWLKWRRAMDAVPGV